MLRALALNGDDLPGNLIVGDTAFNRLRPLAERASTAAWFPDYPQPAARGLRSANDAAQIRFLKACGQMIANTNCLHGTVSLLLHGSKKMFMVVG